MALHTATALNRWAKSADVKTLHAGRLNIGPRLIVGFVFIILSMLAADAVILWQFHLVRTQAERLNGIDQKLVAVLRVHTSLVAFHDLLEDLADSQDANRLVTEGGPLRVAVLEDITRAMSVLSRLPFDLQRDPTILPTLHAVQSALSWQPEAITTLANTGDWRAVHLRLTNQVRPLESLTSELVEKVDHQAGEEQAQTAGNIKRVQRLVFWVVPLTAVFTLLLAATLGLAITRSITQPLARLVEGAQALARGEFQHQVSVTGKDELARLGQVFNDTATRLQQLYATLQRSEDRLRLVIDTIPAHAWSARPDGSVDFVNQRFLEFTGRSSEDVLGWGWGSLVHPDDLTRYLAEWQAAVATGKPTESEARVRRMDGEYRWLLIRNVPLHDDSKNIAKWYGTAIDIEERHRAEDALRRSQAYLAEAQRLSKTGSFGWCVSTGQFTWSEETYKIFEYDRAVKLTLESVFRRIHPEDRDLVQQTIGRAAEARANLDFEHRLLMPDGSVKYLHVLARALEAPWENLEYVGAVTDVTAAKQTEETLRQSEAYLAEAQRLSHTGSWAWSVGAERQFWSVETFQIFGLDPNATAPTRESFLRLVHPDDRATIELVETELYKGNDAEYNYRLILPDGSIKYITSVTHPIRNDSGQVIEFVGTVMDVTERKRAEEERERLRQVQADLAHLSRVTTMSELTASLAHEIKQPISAAITNAKTCLRWLGRDNPDLVEGREAAARIVKDVTRAADIIGRISLLFKKGALQRELVDVNELIREMIVLLRGEASRYSISVSIELAEDLPRVMADRVQLQQVFMNLMLNGIDAMKEMTGELLIKSERHNGKLLISVRDTGVGLPPQQAEQIFNAFFTTKPHGTGMGLCISRSIIESHGGRLWAADNSPRGASFYFTLPAHARDTLIHASALS
jgi:PAS domain S-box-containing protein